MSHRILMILVLSACCSAPHLAQETGETVALTCWISGSAFVERAGESVPLTIYHRLRAGDVIRTAKESEVRLVFRDGRRVAIEAGSRARVKTASVEVLEGSVSQLSSVPALVHLPAIDHRQNPGARPGASRIRTASLDGLVFELYPRDQIAVLPQETELRFTPVAGTKGYHVAVFDADGRQVFADQTSGTMIAVPPEVLAPGATYHWRVRSGDRATTFGTALFSTPSADHIEARAQLAEAARSEKHPDLRLLLADVDRRLGLVTEACRGLEAIQVEEAPAGDLNRALEAFGCKAASAVRTGFQEGG